MTPGWNGSDAPASTQSRVLPYSAGFARAAPTTSWRAKSSASSKAPAAVSPPVRQSAGEWPPTAQKRPGLSRAMSYAPKPPIEMPPIATRCGSAPKRLDELGDHLACDVAAPVAVGAVVPVGVVAPVGEGDQRRLGADARER